MTDDPDARDDLEARLDRLEATLDELRDAIAAGDHIDPARPTAKPATETALRLTERLVVPAAMAALEANVRALEFVQDRLRELERREPGDARPVRGGVSERLLDRFDDVLLRMEEAIATADLPADSEARRLLERARDLNAEVRGGMRDPGAAPTGPDVVRIDVEEELEDIREEVDAEEADRTADESGDESDATDERDDDSG